MRDGIDRDFAKVAHGKVSIHSESLDSLQHSQITALRLKTLTNLNFVST